MHTHLFQTSNNKKIYAPVEVFALNVCKKKLHSDTIINLN